MLKAFSLRSWFKIGIYTFALLLASSEASLAQGRRFTLGDETSPSFLAQITSDNTTNTQVNTIDNVAEITGGETRGGNLFHSFQDFSVPTGNEAFFNNANDISNIFSRVTGGNISNIDGMIRANGSANLFLINPAGILFGENASLNIGGSFYGSSASSIAFENGEFSTDLDNPPLLTVNAPIGLGFRDNPGDIATSQSSLAVNSGETLALLGGDLNFKGGSLEAFGGRVELGGLTESGIVDINSDGSFNFPESVARGNVSFANTAQVFVVGDGGGSININANNLSLTSGSSFFTGIFTESGSPDAQAGDIVINLTKDFVIDNSGINNSIFSGVGNTGDVIVDARNISFSNGGNLTIFNDGEGNTGDIILTATGNINFDGVGNLFFSGIANSFDEEATGNIGEINLTAETLNITNGAKISSVVATNNNSGDINLDIADTIRVDGIGTETLIDGTSVESVSSISSGVSGGNGNSGNVNIRTQNLFLNSGLINSTNSGEGNAGDININVDSLSITGGGLIDGSIDGSGNGGNIIINVTNDLSIAGNSQFFSVISADINSTGTGEAGNIEINTASLVIDGGFISANVFGKGNSGTIKIFATDSIELSDESFIEAAIDQNAIGNSGDLIIETKQLTLNDASSISATTSGNGNAGTLTIIADESINLSGIGTFSRGGIFANALIESGKGGDINLTTDQLTISDGATITASNFSSLGTVAPGTGEPGNISIFANSINLESEGRIEAITQAETGQGAEIDLQVADSIFLSGDSFISAQAFGNANGGNLTIDTNFIVAFAGNNDIIASAEQGQGGNINITAESLLGITAGTLNPFSSDINASSEFGLNGNVTLDVPDVNSLQGASELSTTIVVPEQTTAQACNANREIAAQNGFAIKGKGGVPAAPELPMDSRNIIISGEINDNDAASILPQPVKTSLGDIQPARGIKVKEKGGIILTAYRTNNQGDRLPARGTSCGIRETME